MSGITLAHAFVSAKGNGTDLTLIQPSNWNDQHILKCDAYQILGNQTASNAAIQQIPLTAFMATLLAAADAPTLAGLIGLSSTGDGKLTLKTVADTGWIMLDDTSFGPVGATAAAHTSASYQALFTLIYNNISDAGCPVYTTSGVLSSRAAQGTAASAWAALCVLALPRALGRAFVGAGAGAGLTSRPLGAFFGEESHLLTTTELASHYHSAGIVDPGHSHPYTGASISGPNNNNGGGGGSFAAMGSAYGGFNTTASTTGIYINSTNGVSTTYSAGGGVAHNNTQASAAWNVMVKL